MDVPSLEELLSVNLAEMFPVKPEESSASPPIPVGPNNDQKNLRAILTYLDLYYHYNEGKYPSLKAIQSETNLPEQEILAILETEGNTLLKARGLPEFNTDQAYGNLDPEFVAACSLMVDAGDKRSKAAKLKVLGKTSAWWSASLKKRAHADYYRKRVEEVWDNELRENAKMAVARLIERDDLQAVKHFQEYTGEFSPANAQIFNLQMIIQMLMEILARHVTPNVLASVADELEKSGVLEIGPGRRTNDNSN